MPAERQPPRSPTAPLTGRPAHLAMNADPLLLPPPEVPASLPALGHAPGSGARVGKARAEPGSGGVRERVSPGAPPRETGLRLAGERLVGGGGWRPSTDKAPDTGVRAWRSTVRCL